MLKEVLILKKNIPLSNYEEATSKMIYGTNEEDIIKNIGKRLRWGSEDEMTTKLLDDFDVVLAALIAKYNNEISDYYDSCKIAEENDQEKPKTFSTVIDKLMDIWNKIFPQRELLFEDSKFYACKKEDSIEKYSANQMSDGERAVLYLASQALVVPKNKTLIIDEPELHLNNSIMNDLWEKLENYRIDCLFIYITHDTNFAAYHKNSDKIWIKKYDGNNWDLEKIDSSQLPEKLLLDILGSRKDVLFVEGEKNSFDTLLYSIIYTGYLVVPCGSCSQVIMRTKAFKNTSNLHNFKVYGIIDRDFRTEKEIEKLEQDNIYTLNVAEVENLFLVEELIKYISNHMGKNFDDVFKNIKNYVVNDRLKAQVENQVSQFVVNEIKYRLSTAEISESDTKRSVKNAFENIDINEIHDNKLEEYNNVLDSKDYVKALEIFNEKSLVKSIGNFFGIINKEYLNTVISILKKEEKEEIIKIFRKYIPDEIHT